MLNYSYDTETTVIKGEYRLYSVQWCHCNAETHEESKMLIGVDCLIRYFSEFVEKQRDNCSVHIYNAKWEAKPLIDTIILLGYEFTESKPKDMSPYSFYVMEDIKLTRHQFDSQQEVESRGAVYKIVVKNSLGNVITFTDDLYYTVSTMDKAVKAVRHSYPDWFKKEDKLQIGKMKISPELYDTWGELPETDEKRQQFIEYAKIDAFMQSKIALYFIKGGYTALGLTRSSVAIHSVAKMEFNAKNKQYNEILLSKRFPPMGREAQILIEESLVGGIVYGKIGNHKGKFCHMDYSSSYPYEECKGELFTGPVEVHKESDSDFPEHLKNWKKKVWNIDKGGCAVWIVVTFAFELKDGMLPVLTGRDIFTTNKNHMIKAVSKNLKIKQGYIENMVVKSSYWEALQKHYHIYAVKISQIWYARFSNFAFRRSIKFYYEQKDHDMNGSMERELHKGIMNGAYGKFITATTRAYATYYNGERQTVKTESSPKFNSLVGLSIVQNARARLMNDAYAAISAGAEVLMTDTDSMVLSVPEEWTEKTVRENQKARGFKISEKGIHNLGRWELETDSGGNVFFDEFRCGGLKRYLELNNGKYRKSAFAGMRKAPESFDEELTGSSDCKKENTQLDLMNMDFGKIGNEITFVKNTAGYNKKTRTPYIHPVTKHVKIESIYYEGGI